MSVTHCKLREFTGLVDILYLLICDMCDKHGRYGKNGTYTLNFVLNPISLKIYESTQVLSG